MNQEVLLLIQKECEKIELNPGFGKVLISIENGCVKIIQPSTTILIKKVDKLP